MLHTTYYILINFISWFLQLHVYKYDNWVLFFYVLYSILYSKLCTVTLRAQSTRYTWWCNDATTRRQWRCNRIRPCSLSVRRRKIENDPNQYEASIESSVFSDAKEFDPPPWGGAAQEYLRRYTVSANGVLLFHALEWLSVHRNSSSKVKAFQKGRYKVFWIIRPHDYPLKSS